MNQPSTARKSEPINVTQMLWDRVEEHPHRVAFWSPESQVTYSTFATQARRVRGYLKKANIQPGSSVLVVADLGADLYAIVLGVISHGCSVLFIEPWLSVDRIEHIIKLCEPSAFISNWMGRVWSLRSKVIRKIPLQVSLKEIAGCQADDSPAELVPPGQTAIVSFTSGTSSKPKGVVRSHQYLMEQHRILQKSLALEAGRTGSDLCIFANFALSNLASGVTTILVQRKWPRRFLQGLKQLPDELAVRSLTCGPGFMFHRRKDLDLPHLESLHIGGALTDCWLMKDILERYPTVHATHVYGSSEAEPVAVCDARLALKKSLDSGYFQTLYLGQPIDDIKTIIESDDIWVSGNHVCPAYLGADEENANAKRLDQSGRSWHRMGDRIVEEDGWWYAGRNFQLVEDFQLEQEIYQALGHSNSLIHRQESQRILVGQLSWDDIKLVTDLFPQIDRCVRSKVYRDVRHRARLDRKKMTRKV